MIFKIEPIDAVHGAAECRYDMEKETVEGKSVIRPVYIGSQFIDVHPLTGEPTSAFDVFEQMRLRQRVSHHTLEKPFFRIEARPPVEECRNWDEEKWAQFGRDCQEAVAAITKVINKQKKWVEVHPIDFSRTQGVTTLHVDTDPHLHMLVNRITMDDKALSSHYCHLIAIQAANAIAQKYGWVQADKRNNKRKERIYKDAITVLRGMNTFDIKDYFRGMEAKGWTIQARYDSLGVCRGYSIGETPAGSKRAVMYKASVIGKGRPLMASTLQKTWERLHPNVQTNVSVAATRPSPEPATRSKTEWERQVAFKRAQHRVRDVVESHSKEFTPLDIDDILPEGIAARAIDLDDGIETVENRCKSAAEDLFGTAQDNYQRKEDIEKAVIRDIVSLVSSVYVSVSMGAGFTPNDLPKKKDEDWNNFKDMYRSVVRQRRGNQKKRS